VLARLVRDRSYLLRSCLIVAALSCTTRSAAQVLTPNAPPGADAPASVDPVEPPGYREAIDNAIGEYEAGRFTEARSLFEAAHELFPNARSLRGMGMAEFELRNYPASIYFLEQALAAPVKPLTNDLRTQTEQLLMRSRSFVGKILVELQPPDAALMLNGTRMPIGPDHALTLIAGDYVLQVSAPGYDTEQRPLHVASTQVSEVRVELAKHVEVLQPPQPLAAAGAPEKRVSVFESPWLWAAFGVAVAGAALGLGFAISSGDAGTAKPSGGSSGIVLDGPR
jgi:hypothetical protein